MSSKKFAIPVIPPKPATEEVIAEKAAALQASQPETAAAPPAEQKPAKPKTKPVERKKIQKDEPAKPAAFLYPWQKPGMEEKVVLSNRITKGIHQKLKFIVSITDMEIGDILMEALEEKANAILKANGIEVGRKT